MSIYQLAIQMYVFTSALSEKRLISTFNNIFLGLDITSNRNRFKIYSVSGLMIKFFPKINTSKKYISPIDYNYYYLIITIGLYSKMNSWPIRRN